MILFSFPLGVCVDEVVEIRTNYQGYKYVYFLEYHTLTVSISWMGKELVRLSEKLFLMHSFFYTTVDGVPKLKAVTKVKSQD